MLRYRSTRQGVRPSIPQGERLSCTDTWRIPICVVLQLYRLRVRCFVFASWILQDAHASIPQHERKGPFALRYRRANRNRKFLSLTGIATGRLPRPSWVRCNKIFTLSETIIAGTYGSLHLNVFHQVLQILCTYVGCRETGASVSQQSSFS